MSETRSLVAIWVALVVLLSISVAASFVFTGPLNLLVSWGTATIKGALILWFFMHLREEGGLSRIMAIGAVAWLAILLIMTGADYATRGAH
jgi:cytochrome c oxidase subunit 4